MNPPYRVRTVRLGIALLVTAILSGCSPIKLLNAFSPDGHYTLISGIAYGGQPRNVLDAYLPAAPQSDSPVVVFFYGGGWKGGSRSQYEFVASSLTKAGIVVVIPDYRLYPDVRFPTFVEDGAKAVEWTVDNLPTYGIDPGRVFVMGHSAGAHIAALLALDRSYLASAGAKDVAIAGLIGLSGPYDFLPIEGGYLNDVFPEDSRDRSQPISYVTSDAPRTLLIHGSDDGTVRIRNSEVLAAALESAGVDVDLKVVEDAGHARTVAVLAPPLEFLGKTVRDVEAFVFEQ